MERFHYVQPILWSVGGEWCFRRWPEVNGRFYARVAEVREKTLPLATVKKIMNHLQYKYFHVMPPVNILK